MKQRIDGAHFAQFTTRLQRWHLAVMERLKQWHWRGWLLVTVLLYIVTEFVRSMLSEASTLIVVWFFNGLLWLIRQPIGVGGLGLILLLVILMVTTWLETRPTPTRDDTIPQLSDQERKLIQDLRTIWNRHGERTVRHFQTVLGDAVRRLKVCAYWGGLLDPIIGALDQGIEQMTAAVSFDSKLTLREVRERFNQMYSSYLDAIKWVARLHAHGDVQPDAEEQAQLKLWQRLHYDFYERLQDLHQSPEHHKSLAIFVNYPDDNAFGALLRAAEQKPSE